MRTIQRSMCWICGKEFADPVEAAACEAQGIVLPYFEIGDFVAYEVDLGSDEHGPNFGERNGKIIDILFPVPRQDFAKYALRHNYEVSYLVRKSKPGLARSCRYFEEEQNETLEMMLLNDIVRESDIMQIRYGLHDRPPTVIRTRTANWNEYVSAVIQQNPKLGERLMRFTQVLKNLDSLDESPSTTASS